MHQILEYRKTLRDDGVAFLALDMGDEAEPARVVLIRRVVQSLTRRRQMPLSLGTVFHDALAAEKVIVPDARNAASLSFRQFVAKPFNISRDAAMRQGGSLPLARVAKRTWRNTSRQTVAFTGAKHLRQEAC
ncbi:MAG: hypothetical protein GZ089_04125 [Aromatoleum sp.]|nr:hypothetical protein [Aromatoleum sp.]